MNEDSIRYRPVQERALIAIKQRVQTLREIVASGRRPTPKEKTVVLWLDPGSGKSLTALAALNDLYRIGFIDSAAWFTPRQNLCNQAELDWSHEYVKFYGPPKMGGMLYRQNNPPLVDFTTGQFGYVTTYQSLVANPGLHVGLASDHRLALVADEAQILGWDDGDNSGTQAAKWVTKMAEEAAIILMLTGTPYRQDGRPLTLAHYDGPDHEGRYYLQHDVRGTYTEGVSLGYLRKFDAHLVDGRALYQYLDGTTEEVHLSHISSGFFKVVEAPEYYEGVVDKAIESVLEFQNTYRAFRGLIACNRQRHAEQIIKYINRRYPHINALIAISDERVANDNLRQFKHGDYDILVSVGMAHVGYDCKLISTVCYLGSIRDENWLRQLFARGMRVLNAPEAPHVDDQFVRVIAPDDPLMTRVIRIIQAESEEGLREREQRDGDGGAGGTPTQPLLGTTIESEITRIHAFGNNPQHDVNYEEYEMLEDARRKHGLGIVPFPGLKAFLNELGFGSKAAPTPRASASPPPKRQAPPRTDLEKRKEVRGMIHRVQNSCNRAMQNVGLTSDRDKNSWAQGQTMAVFGSRQEREETLTHLLQVLDWVNTELAPRVESQSGKQVRREYFVDDQDEQS